MMTKEKLEKMKEDIIKNLDKLHSEDLMEISKIAKEIIDKRIILTSAWD